MILTRRRYLLFIVYNIKGDPIPDPVPRNDFSRKTGGRKISKKRIFTRYEKHWFIRVSDIRVITYDAFSYDVSFIRLEICLRGKGRGRANVTYAENRIVDRLRSIYFQYSFSVNGSRRHNVFAEYKTFGKSTVISRKPDSMLSLPLSLFSSSRHTRTRVVLLRFEN